jgi:hypothetical protein
MNHFSHEQADRQPGALEIQAQSVATIGSNIEGEWSRPGVSESAAWN